MTSQIS